jgi:hypothetical protein
MPKAKHVDKTALYIYDAENNEYVVWDGVTKSSSSSGSGEAGLKVNDPNTKLLQDILLKLDILILHHEKASDEKFREEDIPI